MNEGALFVRYLLTRDQFDNDLAKKQLIIGQSIDQTILIENRGNAIDTMNSARLPNVKQCFTLIKKTGEGLRINYGYGGVGFPPSVMSWRCKAWFEAVRQTLLSLQKLAVEKNC